MATNPKKSNPPRRSTRKTGSTLLQQLLDKAPASFQTGHIMEPRLIFAGKERCEDPKTGLAMYGPAAADRGGRNVLRLAIIGTGDTIQCVKNWVDHATHSIKAGLNRRGRPYDPIVSPEFPGIDLDTPFRCQIEIDDPRHCVTLTDKTIERAVSHPTYSERVREMVQVVSDKLEALSDEEPDVVIVAMPKAVEQACGPEARKGLVRKRKLTKIEKKLKKQREEAERTGQKFFDFADPFEDEDRDQEPDKFRDFHNAMKAWAMKSQLPTQLLWESTLTKGRRTEDPATTAWNFFTTLYYKAGNLPWELDVDAANTCFVGVTFYRESPDPDSPTRTCLAQAFAGTGEGLVIRGEPVTWDKTRDKKPHLSETTAKDLMNLVLERYRKHFDDVPRRVVIHKTSRYWPEEIAGFKAALADVHSHDFLAIERRGIRFLRLGAEPPIRGTVVYLARRDYLIYTHGYVPYLRTYHGMRIPNPLEVVEHHGDTSADRVCSEILALTKLNWNSCAFAAADPITIGFSKEVSTILKEMPDGVDPLEKYKFYI